MRKLNNPIKRFKYFDIHQLILRLKLNLFEILSLDLSQDQEKMSPSTSFKFFKIFARLIVSYLEKKIGI